MLVVMLALSIPGRIGGQWKDGEELDKPQIALARIAFWVRGTRRFDGGMERYTGLYLLRRLWLKRIDCGVQFIIQKGFPERVAPFIDNTVTARYQFQLKSGDDQLSGTFSPQKIHFTRNPPSLTERYYLPERPKTWERVR